MNKIFYLADSKRLKYKSRLQAGVLSAFFIFVAGSGIAVLLVGGPLNRGDFWFFFVCSLLGPILAYRAAMMRIEVVGDYIVFYEELWTRRIAIRDIAKVCVFESVAPLSVRVIKRDGGKYTSGAIICSPSTSGSPTLVELAAQGLNAAVQRQNSG